MDRHTMEITLEVSQNKWPPAETLGDLFAANLPALLALPAAAGLHVLRWARRSGCGSHSPIAQRSCFEDRV